jgi:hypothetical protein
MSFSSLLSKSMEQIREHITNLNSFFYKIRSILANRFDPIHDECEGTIYDLRTPTTFDDKANRKSDIKAIGGDMKKALKERPADILVAEK